MPDAQSPPWMARKEWARGWIPCGSRRKAWFTVGFALVWNTISAPLLWVLPEEVIEKDNYAALLGLFFPLVGLGLFVWAVRAVIRWWKFGESILELKTRPGVIGGRFEATLHTRLALGESDEFQVRLVCVNRVTSGSGKNRSTSERIRWEERRTIGRPVIARGMRGASVPMGFTVPYDCEPSNQLNPDNTIVWRLEVDTAVAGVDYAARFDVPVFQTDESSPEVNGDEQLVPELLVGVDSGGPKPFPDSQIRIRSFGVGGRELYFGACRNPGAAASLTGFTLLWLGTIALQL